MAQRTFGKGDLKLSLVTCPVAMMPATTESAKIRFHTINRATGNRIMSRYVDSVTHKVVDDDEQVDRKSTPSELQSLMRISYAVFCLKKKKTLDIYTTTTKQHITLSQDAT